MVFNARRKPTRTHDSSCRARRRAPLAVRRAVDRKRPAPAYLALSSQGARYKILYALRHGKSDLLGWVCLCRPSGFSCRLASLGGFQLSRVQAGLDPEDWKPFDEVGPGTREIRIREPRGAFRVMYVAKFEEAIYVLHCFRKKTPATSLHDKQIAQTRYRALTNARRISP